ncbi:MAG: hypothetical protein KDB27_11420 [Planctomycetales bacterium]|nr:hypothetical protein [Planctomycetales bacterium]
MNRLTVLLALCIGIVISSLAIAADDIAGDYTCKGTNPDGSVYKGEVKIKKAGDAYVITWDLSGQKHSGVGLYLNDVFSATWAYNNAPQHHGVTTYQKQPNGQLQGKWISVRGGRVNTETLTPAKANDERRSRGVEPLKSVRILN